MNGEARRFLEQMYRAALDAVEPSGAVRRALSSPSVRRLLSNARRVGVFAVGKAAAGMAAGTDGRFGPALVVLPHGHPAEGLRNAEVLFASHPDPDGSSMAAARRAIRFFESFERRDAILCLISGGTSALLCLPRPGLSLAEKKRRIRRVARSGASIVELNRVRRSLSAVKGGRLGRRTRARLVTLAISDVPGDRPDLIGSGPTVRGSRRDLVRVIATNALGIAAAAARARELGVSPVRRRKRLAGEASSAGQELARAAGRLEGASALLAGGETTVTLGKSSGRGGRCLELAVGAWGELDRARGIVLLAAGSDGRDGGSRAAGAFADSESLDRARRAGLDFREALRTHDTEPLLDALGDLFVTGPTGTNVADWAFVVRYGGGRT
jgi:glycerate 2-kinase